jgi:hypothetical protein
MAAIREQHLRQMLEELHTELQRADTIDDQGLGEDAPDADEHNRQGGGRARRALRREPQPSILNPILEAR